MNEINKTSTKEKLLHKQGTFKDKANFKRKGNVKALWNPMLNVGGN